MFLFNLVGSFLVVFIVSQNFFGLMSRSMKNVRMTPSDSIFFSHQTVTINDNFFTVVITVFEIEEFMQFCIVIFKEIIR